MLRSSSSSISNTVVVDINEQTFKSFAICDVLRVPDDCPPIQEIVDVTMNTLITTVSTVSTPIGTSLEGQILTGYKVVVCGKLCTKVNYVACSEDQAIYNIDYALPFCNFIVTATSYSAITEQDIIATIEDMFYEKIDCRSFTLCTNLLIQI